MLDTTTAKPRGKPQQPMEDQVLDLFGACIDLISKRPRKPADFTEFLNIIEASGRIFRHTATTEPHKRRGKPTRERPDIREEAIKSLIRSHIQLFGTRPWKQENFITWLDALEVFERVVIGNGRQ